MTNVIKSGGLEVVAGEPEEHLDEVELSNAVDNDDGLEEDVRPNEAGAQALADYAETAVAGQPIDHTRTTILNMVGIQLPA